MRPRAQKRDVRRQHQRGRGMAKRRTSSTARDGRATGTKARARKKRASHPRRGATRSALEIIKRRPPLGRRLDCKAAAWKGRLASENLQRPLRQCISKAIDRARVSPARKDRLRQREQEILYVLLDRL